MSSTLNHKAAAMDAVLIVCFLPYSRLSSMRYICDDLHQDMSKVLKGVVASIGDNPTQDEALQKLPEMLEIMRRMMAEYE